MCDAQCLGNIFGVYKMRMFIGLGLMAALLAGCGGGSGGTDCAGSVNRCNVPPVAIASAAPTVLVGSTVSLDGSKSMDGE